MIYPRKAAMLDEVCKGANLGNNYPRSIITPSAQYTSGWAAQRPSVLGNLAIDRKIQLGQ